ncbi:PREDICTED: protein CDV3 homolog [Branchiostoma belcheri]|uniref:Protein CDV3 homolog n=1 Tax=Branchiostoma belcheri TaxID=7741 RepID=A0A6P4Z865_BRABE|nr:PREDICTED: protein CDV3 homolog [Branchiostoma belcheri]
MEEGKEDVASAVEGGTEEGGSEERKVNPAEDAKSLDDFFAKKDKSKGKKKKGKISTDVLAKELEGPGKKKATKKKKEKGEKVDKGPSKEGSPVEEDADWIQIEEPGEKDYSGLRIASLNISEQRQEEQEPSPEEEQEYDEAGEPLPPRESAQQGPWKMLSGGEQPSAVAEAPPPEPSPAPAPAAAGAAPSKYIPPSLRAAMAAQESRATPSWSGRQRGSRAPPEITSEQHFPSLAASLQDKPPGMGQRRAAEENRQFSTVTRGARGVGGPEKNAPLETQNPYAALSRR